MANPIDVISKNSSSTNEVSLVSDKEVTKDSPSLFDSLLKDSMGTEKEEQTTLKQDVLVKKEPINKDMLIVEQSNNVVLENTENIDLKNSNNSLLDRLVLEAKNETLKEQKFDKALNNKILNDTSKNNENIKIEPQIVISIQDNQDTKIDLEKVVLDENIKNNQEAKIEVKDETITKDLQKENIKIEPQIVISTQDNKDTKIDLEKVVLDENIKNNQEAKIEVKDETITKDLQKENIKIEPQIVISTQDNKDTKIDLEKVVLDENIKNNQEAKIEVKDETITKDLQKDIQILKSNEDKEISNQNSSQNIESQVVASVVDLETQKVETKIDTKEEIVPLITKEYVVDSQDNQNINSKKSLMDILIEKNSKNPMLNILENETIIKTELEQSKDFLSNLYLGGQKNLLNSQFLLNKSEAINILKNANSLTDIEKSASILELGLQDVDVEQNVDLKTLELVKKQDLNNLDKKNLLDSLLMEKSIRSEDVKHLITKSIEASNALLENTLNVAEDVELSVNSPLSYNIQSRIIGAKQQMSTMMSDIARQMYENYRPPVTVFRINLNPLELGSIAILMKNDKNSNALTISMNASNGGTLEALVENQNVLRNSLNKTFDENTIFNLDFTSSNQNNQQSSNGQSNSNQQNRFEGQIDTQSVLQLKEENKDREDKVLDYM
ncbi:flagellar hook-length control protein FliK [Arcobacter cloacae]|uniref:Flagellar hook-length control protein FliK n=1 Tax=Arcobacter cloacae TaxID=1054034 RepID=A0A6M8NVJ5_9BACT|nr:flagellar hook-length control protein FliK [Arcobacter cloacae]QKF90656.1 flagellar hook-length control protein FliK [Arcobacter cloacae]RXI41439.1 flagellar hook-length control protein FliK [Arcobacter cloacae]